MLTAKYLSGEGLLRDIIDWNSLARDHETVSLFLQTVPTDEELEDEIDHESMQSAIHTEPLGDFIRDAYEIRFEHS